MPNQFPNMLFRKVRQEATLPRSLSSAMRHVKLSSDGHLSLMSAYERASETLATNKVTLPYECLAALYAFNLSSSGVFCINANKLFDSKQEADQATSAFYPYCRLLLQSLLLLPVYPFTKVFIPLESTSKFVGNIRTGEIFAMDQLIANGVGTYDEAVKRAQGHVLVIHTAKGRLLSSGTSVAEIVVLPGTVLFPELVDVVDGVTRIRAYDISEHM